MGTNDRESRSLSVFGTFADFLQLYKKSVSYVCTTLVLSWRTMTFSLGKMLLKEAKEDMWLGFETTGTFSLKEFLVPRAGNKTHYTTDYS